MNKTQLKKYLAIMLLAFLPVFTLAAGDGGVGKVCKEAVGFLQQWGVAIGLIAAIAGVIMWIVGEGGLMKGVGVVVIGAAILVNLPSVYARFTDSGTVNSTSICPQ